MQTFWRYIRQREYFIDFSIISDVSKSSKYSFPFHPQINLTVWSSCWLFIYRIVFPRNTQNHFRKSDLCNTILSNSVTLSVCNIKTLDKKYVGNLSRKFSFCLSVLNSPINFSAGYTFWIISCRLMTCTA